MRKFSYRHTHASAISNAMPNANTTEAAVQQRRCFQLHQLDLTLSAFNDSSYLFCAIIYFTRYVYTSKTGSAWQPSPTSGAPAFTGTGTAGPAGLISHPTAGWIAYQIVLAASVSNPTTVTPPAPAQTPSTAHAHTHAPAPAPAPALTRRVLASRTSTNNGASWSAPAAAAYQASPQAGLDPPDLQFWSLIPYWYGNELSGVMVSATYPIFRSFVVFLSLVRSLARAFLTLYLNLLPPPLFDDRQTTQQHPPGATPSTAAVSAILAGRPV
jgi:hypothetical protein